MRTQFFQDMVADSTQKDKDNMNTEATEVQIWTPCVLVPEPTTLEVTAEQSLAFPEDQNPYLHPEVYRRMLREQTMARVRARMA